MKIKICFECKGLGVKWTLKKVRRYLSKVPKHKRIKELANLQSDKSKCQCKLCNGSGVLIYP